MDQRLVEREGRGTGGQGRIRTFVPRKEGQIYSLLALTTHPPVRVIRLIGRRSTSTRIAHARREAGQAVSSI